MEAQKRCLLSRDLLKSKSPVTQRRHFYAETAVPSRSKRRSQREDAAASAAKRLRRSERTSEGSAPSALRSLRAPETQRRMGAHTNNNKTNTERRRNVPG